ncbi:hypothetical protein Lal_00038286 [Lupinus albus]|uniref:Putative transcription factor bHLH family n=1 Tax=Lupinus albus TaxID=3870 RepID=A0A6A5N947_LUPAL|nr:putative transcription factor bHLH family [Lupinus albus]KAF1883931.1 hypothetical protein Lal_00038286 [Lupinus albus]
MEDTSITQFLKSFCDYTQWKYVAFWKLNHHFPMTLTWENGYYGYQKTNEVVESLGGVLNFKSQDWVYSSRGDNTDGLEDNSCRLLMTEMSHLKYSLGEGVVGKIALSGDHCWIFGDDLLTNNFDTNLVPECPDEWLLQFASGIKTIVLVPVLPQGVLQFGSFEVVVEDLRFIADVKDKFQSVYCRQANAESLNLGMNIQDWSFSDITDTIMDSLDESSSITNIKLKGEVSGCTALNVNESTRLNPTMPPFIQDECFVLRENEAEINHLEQEMWACFQWGSNVGLLGETSNGSGSYSGKSLTQQQFGGTEAGHNDVENVNEFFTFPSESELHKALGSSVAYRQTDKSLSKRIRAEDTHSSSTLIPNKEQHDHINGFDFPKEVDPEYLLDAVFSNLCSASDDTSSISNSVRSPVTMPMKFTTSLQPNINSEESDLTVKNSDVESNLMSAGTVKARDGFTNHFTSPSFDGNLSILHDEARGEKFYSMHQPISGPKLLSKSKKRAKVGNNQRSRPRDRQMIMDRMKELRELVPDGGRCSIDNLLERTINHMVYLRKITSQAEKLKRFAHREVPKCNKQKIKGSHPGRICAIDFESELPWPIVIEDLDSSGHMLIEMICNEHGLFLEIAQVIREMDLTILKGVLEERSSTAWARFIVEVPRGFHRMDVLCPLLHLLQLRRNSEA